MIEEHPTVRRPHPPPGGADCTRHPPRRHSKPARSIPTAHRGPGPAPRSHRTIPARDAVKCAPGSGHGPIPSASTFPHSQQRISHSPLGNQRPTAVEPGRQPTPPTGDGRRAPIMMITVYGRDVRADVTPRPNLEVLPARPVVRPAERPRNRCGETFTGSPRWRRLETPAHEADKSSGSPRRFLDHRTPGQARRCRLPVTIPGPAGTGTGLTVGRAPRRGSVSSHL